MGVVKEYNRPVADAGRLDNVQALTSTGIDVLNFGLTTINTTEAAAFSLGNDPKAGLRKTVVMLDGPSTGVNTLDGNGATINGSTDLDLGIADAVELIGLSTAAWAIVSLTTA